MFIDFKDRGRVGDGEREKKGGRKAGKEGGKKEGSREGDIDQLPLYMP